MEQMMNDKVQLIHAGQIIHWEDTPIPEILQKIKEDLIIQNLSLENDND